MPTCPQCGSHLVRIREHEGLTYRQCRICHYDELEETILPAERSTQREKRRFSPYKQGGKGRVRKK